MHLPFLIEPHLTRRQKWLRCGVVLMLILGIAVWASMTRKVVFKTVAATGSCPADLGLLDDAITQWAMDNAVTNTLAQPKAADLKGYFNLGNMPVCSQGGVIALGTDALASTCSVHGIARRNSSVRLRMKQTPNWKQLAAEVQSGSADLLGSICRQNLRRIDGARQQSLMEIKVPSSTVVPASFIVSFLTGTNFPVCPQGGKYHLGTVSTDPVCTLAPLGHTL